MGSTLDQNSLRPISLVYAVQYVNSIDDGIYITEMYRSMLATERERERERESRSEEACVW